MEPTTQGQSGAEGDPQKPKNPPDVQRHAAAAAAKHPPAGQAAPNFTMPGRNKGGRRTVQEEAAEFLRSNGLVAVPAGSDNAQALPPPEPQYVVTPEFVEDCVKTLLKGVEAWRVMQVYEACKILEADDKLCRELAGQASPPPGTIDVMSRCAAEIAQKWNLLSVWSPEAFFVIGGVLWYKKDQDLLKQIRALAEKKKAKDATASAGP